MACCIYAFLATVLYGLPYLCIPGDSAVRLAVIYTFLTTVLYGLSDLCIPGNWCTACCICTFLATVLYGLPYLYIPGECDVWLAVSMHS